MKNNIKQNRIVEINYLKQGIELIIKNNYSNKKIFGFFLLLLGFFSFVFPFFLLFFIKKAGISFGFIITLLIFFGSAYFFFKLYLWNYHGSEVFKIYQDRLIHYNNFRFFKDNTKSTPYRKLELGFINIDNQSEIVEYDLKDLEKNTDYFLAFVIDDNIIKSELSISFENLKRIMEVVMQ